jgi:outer membrane protein
MKRLNVRRLRHHPMKKPLSLAQPLGPNLHLGHKIYLMKYLFTFCIWLMAFQAWAQSPKIGYVQPEVILASLPETKKIESELKTFQAQLEGAVRKLQQDFLAKRAEAEKLDIEKTPRAVVEAKVKEIRDLEDGYNEFVQKAQADMEKKRNDLLQPVLARIQAEIEALAKAENYDLVFDAGNARLPVLLFAKPEADLTNRIITKMGGTVPPKSN